MEKIDWGKIPEGFDWAATDENGELWAYKRKPEDGFCMWFVGDDKDQIRISGPVVGGYKGGSWRESLQHRPSKEPEIKFGKGTNVERGKGANVEWGPRPEKLWVGMKGKNRNGSLATLDVMTENCLTWRYAGLIVTTSITGRFGENSKYNIVEWEQPRVTCCDPEPEPDWKAKCVDLYLTHMEKVDECTTLRERCDELEHALEQTEIELRCMYGYREKLNKIVNLLNEA